MSGTSIRKLFIFPTKNSEVYQDICRTRELFAQGSEEFNAKEYRTSVIDILCPYDFPDTNLRVVWERSYGKVDALDKFLLNMTTDFYTHMTAILRNIALDYQHDIKFPAFVLTPTFVYASGRYVQISILVAYIQEAETDIYFVVNAWAQDVNVRADSNFRPIPVEEALAYARKVCP